ncbi:baseplate assembly protein [Aeromonas hydrophila]|uniref:phage baseplate assembly protein V n=1 Tax=Aeromonas hydrophila TaxID=644 RepID=UPI001115FADA|nr:phage baseplate assembly protein V [Aeromonas hydrophila]TNH89155.1 baseplate assembly protein [Aeromonas hydrophila]TNI00947.1 baseplate assembly protein [Aeromonas hydrophila]TNI98000.1 baseplate assembly protein [Aeromonas hydrophila]
MQPTPTELQRLIDNLIRIGTVTAVRSGECRVKTGDLITNWRPYAAARAGKNRTRNRLSIGEQVLMLSVSGDLRNAYIVGPINCIAFPEPLEDDDNPDLDRTEYSDGAIIEYNPQTGELNATGIMAAKIKANVSVTFDAPKVICTNLLQAKRVISETAKIGHVEVTTHSHKEVQRGSDTSGSPV